MRGSRAWRTVAGWLTAPTTSRTLGMTFMRDAGGFACRERPGRRARRELTKPPGSPAGSSSLSAAAGMSSIAPTTGTPRRDRPWALRSSSNTRDRDESGLRATEHVAHE